MAFTNVWDTTFPPDTQLANLLGQDLRNLRFDIQQRMSAISGLDAAKPPFQTDAQPTNWNGVLFFATDTAQIYQFNNPSWINVTGSFKNPLPIKQITPQSIVSPAGSFTLATLTIPANYLSVGNMLRISGYVTCGGGSSSGNLQFNISGSPMTATALGGDIATFNCLLAVTGGASFSSTGFVYRQSISQAFLTTGAIVTNIGAPIAVTVTGTAWAGVGSTLTSQWIMVEVL